MDIQNNKRQIITPFLISISVIAGIFLGMWFRPHPADNRFVIYPKSDKLNNILNFVESDYVDSVSKSDLVEKIIPIILEDLDPHSVYIPAKDLERVNEPLEGNFSGIGVQFNMQNDTVAIISTIPNGPSEKVGIVAGDRIITVDSDTVAGVKMPSDSVVRRLKGPRGTEVIVGIQRKHVDHLIDFTITRDNIPLYSVDVSYMINDSIGFLKLSKFARTTFEEFIQSVTSLKNQGMKKLVLDLRDNSGGYLDQATSILDQFFVNNELLVYTQGKARPRQDVHATSKGICSTLELVVLINEWSASASEIIAGAIQDNDRGLIIGRRSFGKGLVQEPHMLSDGSAIRLTIARYYTPTGRCIQKPYNHGMEDYYHDLSNRYMNGEFLEKDSITFADTVKYITPKGKVVYGGGGIMPDLFVPFDTSLITDYYIRLRNTGLIYRFAFSYTDNNRDRLNQFQTPAEISLYLTKKNILKEFTDFASKNGVPLNSAELKISKSLIENQVKAYIARNIIDNKGFYPIIGEIDETLKVAVDELMK